MAAGTDATPAFTTRSLPPSPVQRLRARFVEVAASERQFLILLAASFIAVGLFYRQPVIAAWLGFAFAGYAATTNDSIQTLGTFLASNSHRRWWVLWAFIATILVVTLSVSWYLYDGDVSFQRLSAKGFETAPTQFSYLQVAAPLFLLILTRLKMPVSTTFLCLSGFAATAGAIGSVVMKSVIGYGVAFAVGFGVWFFVRRIPSRVYAKQAHVAWQPIQWLVSGALWAVWLMQDAANVAVFLPRQLSLLELGGVLLLLVLGLGVLFWLRGDKIQQVVTEKSNVLDVRAATAIDFVYAITLFIFQGVSKVPMSTTWVFVGLLAGRELAFSLFNAQQGTTRTAARMIGKDIAYVTIGLLVSLAIAVAVNPVISEAWLGAIGF